jgi:hypothetical protein
MPELEIKDVQSAATYRVADKGAIIGREGAKADIVLRNPSVSKRHAKIYADSGAWFLEDLGSSNGTFFANQRISEPVEISPGSFFALAEIQFEVIRTIGAGNEATDDELGSGPPSGKNRASIETDPPPPEPPEPSVPAQARKGSRMLGPPPVIEPKSETGFPALLGAIPKAIAHYMVAIPKLAIMPIGTVRKGIEEQSLPTMDGWQLAGWALPVMLFNALVGFICALIVQLVSGTFSIGGILPIGPLVGALLGSLLAGFIWHPVVRWFVALLKGTSDEHSRSNWFVMSMASSALVTIPSGLALLFGLIPVRLIAIAPILIGLYASLIGTFIAYSWFVHFQVVKWFQYVLMALGVLSILGAGSSTFTLISSGGSPGGLTAEQQAAIEQARKLAEQAGANTEESAAAGKEQAEALAKLAGTVANTVEREAEKAAEADEDAKPEEKRPDPPQEAAKAPEPPPAKTPEPPPAKTPEPAKAVEPPPAPPAGAGYPAFASRREMVEKAIAEDPTILKRPGVLPVYERYLKARFEVSKAWSSKKAKEPWKQPINDRLRDVEMYEKTGKILDELYSKIIRR